MLLLGNSFGLGTWHCDLDPARFCRREGTGDVLEGLALGLGHEEDDEDEKHDQQRNEQQECVLLQLFLDTWTQPFIYSISMNATDKHDVIHKTGSK